MRLQRQLKCTKFIHSFSLVLGLLHLYSCFLFSQPFNTSLSMAVTFIKTSRAIYLKFYVAIIFSSFMGNTACLLLMGPVRTVYIYNIIYIHRTQLNRPTPVVLLECSHIFLYRSQISLMGY